MRPAFPRYVIGIVVLLIGIGGYAQPDSRSIEEFITEADQLLLTNDILLLEEKAKEIRRITDTIKDRRLKIRCFHFLGGLARKKGANKKSYDYYSDALQIIRPSEFRNMAISYLGMSNGFTDRDIDLEVHYSKKAHENAVKAKDKEWIIYSSVRLVDLFRKKGELQSAAQYLGYCDDYPENKSCRLARGELAIARGAYKEGTRLFWEMVIEDAQVLEVNTTFAISNLVSLSIAVGAFDDAKRLTELILLNDHIKQPSLREPFVYYAALIAKKKGDYSKAKSLFEETVREYTNHYFRSEAIWELYNLQVFTAKRKGFKKYIGDLTTAAVFWESDLGIILEYLIAMEEDTKSRTGTALKLMKYLKANAPDIHADKWELILSRIIGNDPEAISEEDQRFLQKQWNDKRLSTLAKRERLTNGFFNAQNTAYKEVLDKNEKKLLVQGKKLAQEQSVKEAYRNLMLIAVIALIIISFSLYRMVRDYKRIKTLSGRLAIKNERLRSYGKEYETMLMILAHHVKKPVNHLYYVSKDVTEQIKTIKNQTLSRSFQRLQEHTRELSERLNLSLGLIKTRIEDTEEKVAELNIADIVNDRLWKFRKRLSMDLDINFDIESAFIIPTKRIPLSIVIDHILDNIRTHGKLDAPIIVICHQEENGKVALVFKNIIKDKREEDEDGDLVDSQFGLGHQIVQSLCSEINVELQYERQYGIFSVSLLFPKPMFSEGRESDFCTVP